MQVVNFTYRLLFGLLVLSAQTIASAQDQISSDEQWAAINLQVTDELVIPAYRDLADKAQQLLESTTAFCQSPQQDSLLTTQQAFNSTMDSWQSIQHIQFGPVTYFNWNFRMQYWPDERGTANRQFTALLAAENEDILSADNFARQSVGVQGLPILERLLYEDTALNDFQSTPYLCRLAVTIATNIMEISSGVSERWTDEYRAVVLDPDSGGVYENSLDLSIEFLKALQEALAKIRDLKISPVVGESADALRLRSAESWRSQRSLRNIQLDIMALESLFVAYTEAFQAADVNAVLAAFADIKQSLMELPSSFEEASQNEAGYAQLQTLLVQADALHEALEAGIKNTDLYLGFNSLDGD